MCQAASETRPGTARMTWAPNLPAVAPSMPRSRYSKKARRPSPLKAQSSAWLTVKVWPFQSEGAAGSAYRVKVLPPWLLGASG